MLIPERSVYRYSKAGCTVCAAQRVADAVGEYGVRYVVTATELYGGEPR